MIHAPEFPKAEWLNTAGPLSLAQLKGHVVLLDFWTYCCINCIHVLPELKSLESAFAGQPVVVIGVHSAKFENEKVVNNITSAIARYEIDHPVIVDSDHLVWDAYAVHAWPTLVLIDPEGRIRGQVSGEGHQAELTDAIEQLLSEAKQKGTLAAEPLALHSQRNNSVSTLHFPGKIALDHNARRLCISDSNHNRLLVTELVSPTQARITKIIGGRDAGNHDGSFSEARFNRPQGLFLDQDSLFVCDTDNHRLCRIDLSSEKVTTIAGTGQPAEWGSSGGLGQETALNSPWDVVKAQDALWIAMAGTHQIWRYDPKTMKVEPWIGSGHENILDGTRRTAQLAQPSGLSANEQSLFFADSETSAIRRFDWHTEEVTTLVGQHLFIFGSTDGDLDEGLLQHPLGVAVDGDEVFVADTYNHALRHIDLKTKRLTTLIAKVNQTHCRIGDAKCQVLPLQEPNDVKVAGRFVYIADTNNHLIRVWDRQEKTLLDLELLET